MTSKISQAEKRKCAISAMIGSHIVQPDSTIIERQGWYQIVTPSSESSSLNEIIFSEVSDENVDKIIESAIKTYQDLNVSFKWCVGPWTRPENFGEYLDNRGFVSWPVRAMAWNVDEIEVNYPKDVIVSEVDHGNLEDFLVASAAGWGSEFGPAQGDAVRFNLQMQQQGSSKHYFYVAYVDSQPVGTASFVLKSGSAYLKGASVAAAYRGRGVYRALIQARLDKLRVLSVRLATTHAREATSVPILEKLGFETLFHYTVYQMNVYVHAKP